MKYWCSNCERVFEYKKPPQDLFCEDPDCWGQKLVEYTGQEQDSRAGKEEPVAQPPEAVGTIEGLCLLVCDASFSMDEKAFSDKEPSKLKMITIAVHQAITELFRISKPAEAFVGIIGFGARADFVSDHAGKPFVISVEEIQSQFGGTYNTSRPAVARNKDHRNMGGEENKESCRRLMIEAFVSAGERKSPEEYRGGAKELCEDCAGYMAIRDYVVFWICDGTSNSNELPKRPSHFGFNSRILAQDLGTGFAKVMAKGVGTAAGVVSDIDLQRNLFAEIADDWQRRLIDYMADVERAGELEQMFAAMPHMADGSRGMKWSSALLGGVYKEQERTLDVINIGDSGAVVIAQEIYTVSPKTTNELFFATLSRTDKVEVEVCPVNVDAEWEHFKGVECFFAMSDGVSARKLDVLLHQIDDDLMNDSIDEMRRQLLMRWRS